ncbi:precorrin-6y C5,15-methyltransferase (decarboxylating) subunit CbiE [Salininema proteolyticum]|uniref:Precorrin-6y C5,15-methyltransferase (Decarboxylating) subunit CbiE n=1 Tax=Salininema proteolyticum TaxID=1607685 RepID=A0ABV8U685_9ACTN
MIERLTVIGVGYDGVPAAPVPGDASVIVAGKRHLERFAPEGVATLAITTSMDAVCDEIEESDGHAVVLASGDPGWFGVVRSLGERFGPHLLDVRPAVSSIAAAFAALGLSWEDAVVVSAHGRSPRPALAALLRNPKTAVLTSPEHGPDHFVRELVAAGADEGTIAVVERLGHPDERIVEKELLSATGPYADPNVLVFLRQDESRKSTLAHTAASRPWGRPVTDFVHRDGQITKPSVRALALAHLAPGPGRLLWDIGCGSGSVAVEAAHLGAGVIAFDRDPEQVDRTRANAAEHGVHLGLKTGHALEVLPGLPTADAAFVGGGGLDLHSIIAHLAEREVERIVVALATVERVAEAHQQVSDLGWDADTVQLSVNRLAPLAGGHRLAPENPVFLITGERTP